MHKYALNKIMTTHKQLIKNDFAAPLRCVYIVRQNRIGFVVPTLTLIATGIVHLETRKVLITYNIQRIQNKSLI